MRIPCGVSRAQQSSEKNAVGSWLGLINVFQEKRDLPNRRGQPVVPRKKEGAIRPNNMERKRTCSVGDRRKRQEMKNEAGRGQEGRFPF